MKLLAGCWLYDGRKSVMLKLEGAGINQRTYARIQ